MPARQITPQSFDEILSELGDDPAIPDPHGIRKTSSPKAIHPQAQRPTKGLTPLQALNALSARGQIQKMGLFLGIATCLIGLSLALFLTFESIKTYSEASLHESQNQIRDLQKELALLRAELLENQESLYDEIDALEVSIHSLKQSKSFTKSNAKPQAAPNESELKNWRFLGTAQIRGSHHAFFHTGKKNVVFEKGALVLGDWRLMQIEPEHAFLSHPGGKNLLLKASKRDSLEP